MNKNFLKTTGCLITTIIFLLVVILIASLGFTAIWLHTYKVFTAEKLVAEITVSGQKEDTNGNDYFDLSYKPIKEKSVLTNIFDKSKDESEEFGDMSNYKLYGDHFEIGGPVVKFDNWATLFGFQTVYKVARLEGDFTDADDAKTSERSVEEIEGGIDGTWKYLEQNEGKLDFMVDTVYGSYVTKFIQDKEKTYGLYITEDGFIIEELEVIKN